MKNSIHLLSVFSIFTLSSCSEEVEREFLVFNESKFQSEKKLWEENKPNSYSFQQNYFASTGPVDEYVKVLNGVAIFNDTNTMQIGSIDKIFSKVLSDIEQAKKQKDARQITVEIQYNPTYHYPEKIDFSTSYNEPIAGGFWYNLEIKDFELIQ